MITISHDKEVNVIYVKYKDAIIVNSCADADDGCIIVNYDRNKNVVGFQILLMDTGIDAKYWRKHYSNTFPQDLFNAVYNWLVVND